MGSLVAEWARLSPNGLELQARRMGSQAKKTCRLYFFFEYVAAFWGWQKPGLITKYSKAGMGAWA